MKPYIEFFLKFDLSNRLSKRDVSKNDIQIVLLSLCPFDHLPGEIIRTRKNEFIVRVFFTETQYLETAYRHLEGKMEELRDSLNLSVHNLGGEVKDAQVGVLSTTDVIEVKNYS
ncbi:hypothetical protein [Candidatus Hodarchaeum mangrovi]